MKQDELLYKDPDIQVINPWNKLYTEVNDISIIALNYATTYHLNKVTFERH